MVTSHCIDTFLSKKINFFEVEVEIVFLLYNAAAKSQKNVLVNKLLAFTKKAEVFTKRTQRILSPGHEQTDRFTLRR